MSGAGVESSVVLGSATLLSPKAKPALKPGAATVACACKQMDHFSSMHINDGVECTG